MADEEQAEPSSEPSLLPDIPERFQRLYQDIWTARMMHHCGTVDEPLYKIGRFDALGYLSAGGYGVVFLARDPRLDREVAIKLCNSRAPRAQEAFLREAQLLAKLAHPNVLRVFETGEWQGENFYVMEVLKDSDGFPCRTGHDFIPRCATWQQAVEFYKAAGEGLAAVHARGIVHGDFKPSNILVEGDRILIADFGLAQVIDQGLRHQLGTPAYMAPEVLRGKPGDARSDQWSFCVSIWETMDRRLPFAGESVEELLESIEGGEPREVEPPEVVPAELRAILRIGLSKDPEDRYPSMRALLFALGELQRPAKAPPHQSPGHKGRGIFIVSSVLAFGVMLGSLGTFIVMKEDGDQVVTAPALEQKTKMLRAVEPSEKALTDVLAQIEAGEFEDAMSGWDTEWERRFRESIPATRDTVRVAAALLERAKALQIDGDNSWRDAATKARTIAAMAQSLKEPASDEAQTNAATIRREANMLLSAQQDD